MWTMQSADAKYLELIVVKTLPKTTLKTEDFTFFTSAKRSFFLTGLFLTSDVCCRDLDSTDSLSDSEWLSDSEELFDSELCDLRLSLPWSLSDWLPDSDTEWLDSSEAELL